MFVSRDIVGCRRGQTVLECFAGIERPPLPLRIFSVRNSASEYGAEARLKFHANTQREHGGDNDSTSQAQQP